MVSVVSDLKDRSRLGLLPVLRRRQGLVGPEALVLLARAEGLSDAEIRGLVASWPDVRLDQDVPLRVAS